MKDCFRPFFPMSLFVLLCACAPKPTAPPAEPASTYFPITLGSETVQLQLALNDPERAQGLMYRTTLPEDHGMLFLFEKAEPRSFWMRNTRIPLDIGYFDSSGKLLEIHSLYPYDETPVLSYSQKVLIAIEMNRNWYASHGLTPGAFIDLESLTDALTQRGQSLNDFPMLQQR